MVKPIAIMIKNFKKGVYAEEKVLELVHVLRAGELSSDDLLRHAPLTASFIWTVPGVCHYNRMHCG